MISQGSQFLCIRNGVLSIFLRNMPNSRIFRVLVTECLSFIPPYVHIGGRKKINQSINQSPLSQEIVSVLMLMLMYTLHQGNVAILGKEWSKNQVLYSQQIDIKIPMYKVYFRVNMKSIYFIGKTLVLHIHKYFIYILCVITFNIHVVYHTGLVTYFPTSYR